MPSECECYLSPDKGCVQPRSNTCLSAGRWEPNLCFCSSLVIYLLTLIASDCGVVCAPDLFLASLDWKVPCFSGVMEYRVACSGLARRRGWTSWEIPLAPGRMCSADSKASPQTDNPICYRRPSVSILRDKEEKLKTSNEKLKVCLQPPVRKRVVSLWPQFVLLILAVWSTAPKAGRGRPPAHWLVRAEIACENNEYVHANPEGKILECLREGNWWYQEVLTLRNSTSYYL